jgi:hypothetical protein
VIAEDRIETVGAGIDAVTDHVIVTVVTDANDRRVVVLGGEERFLEKLRAKLMHIDWC